MAKVNAGAKHRVAPKPQPQPKPVKHNPPKAPVQAQVRAKSVNPSEAMAVKSGIDRRGSVRADLGVKLVAFSARSSASRSKVESTQLTATNRHKGVYDRLPSFTDRPKAGLHDRYRAVNPQRMKAGVKGDKVNFFPLVKGKSHILVDGNGVRRGAIRSRTEVKLNYAAVKRINGEKHYYAFSTRIDHDKNPKTAPLSASGWIKASAIVKSTDPKYSRGDVAKSQLAVPENHGKHKDYKQYVVKNVAPEKIRNKNGKLIYGYVENGKFVSYKVLPGESKKANVAATDYLRRRGNVINLGFNAAGVSNDTFRTDVKGKPVVFHRAPTSLKETTIDIDLYHPKDSKNPGTKPLKKMRFVYGFVETQGQKRWGWMAFGALKAK